MVSLSLYGMAHPPRWNPPLRSSSRPPEPLHHSVDGDDRCGRPLPGRAPLSLRYMASGRSRLSRRRCLPRRRPGEVTMLDEHVGLERTGDPPESWLTHATCRGTKGDAARGHSPAPISSIGFRRTALRVGSSLAQKPSRMAPAITPTTACHGRYGTAVPAIARLNGTRVA